MEHSLAVFRMYEHFTRSWSSCIQGSRYFEIGGAVSPTEKQEIEDLAAMRLLVHGHVHLLAPLVTDWTLRIGVFIDLLGLFWVADTFVR